MTDMKLRKLVLAALFAALCTVMTMVIQVPSPMQGYVNLGDCAVLLSAWVLGPWYGGAAAGLGSMLADLLSYPHYAPGTLVIKFTMAVAAAYIFEAMRERSGKLAALRLDYAVFPADGYYNMDVAEASACAKLVDAAHSIPIHLVPIDDPSDPAQLFDTAKASAFDAKGKIVLKPGDELTL